MSANREDVDPIYKQKFIEDLERFIHKVKKCEGESTTCETVFSNSDSYCQERAYLRELALNKFKTTKERGDVLENLVQSIFNRIDLLDGITVTRKQTLLGQLDLQLVTLRDYIYDIWGMFSDKPESDYIVGECKNYTTPVGRDEIERACWRASKGSCLFFFIATSYTQPALDEIAYFNKQRDTILIKHKGVYIVPLSLPMIEAVIANDINFCYFLKWAIKHSKIMTIINYLKL